MTTDGGFDRNATSKRRQIRARAVVTTARHASLTFPHRTVYRVNLCPETD